MPHFSETITVTELARNLASVIDHVRISSTPVSVTRGTQTVAEINPAVQPGITLGNLLDVLQRESWANKDKRRYAADLKTVRKSAALPPSPWE
ncbi:MAG: hypothetical protein DSZ28_03715 [Thiothrix sp.]|nr:MAG: hypothetical protein DSZ28_03715 [Thiothrix sp.]